jgi:hypothetical protein
VFVNTITYAAVDVRRGTIMGAISRRAGVVAGGVA